MPALRGSSQPRVRAAHDPLQGQRLGQERPAVLRGVSEEEVERPVQGRRRRPRIELGRALVGIELRRIELRRSGVERIELGHVAVNVDRRRYLRMPG